MDKESKRQIEMASKGPGRHPEPGDLSGVRLPLKESESTWFRCHQKDFGALYFGRRGDSRFDAPEQEYGVLYVAETLEGAFIETLGLKSKAPVRHITLMHLEARRFTEISFAQPLRLVDLTSAGLAVLGADARICAGGDYTVSQLWSLALWQHPDQPDGILYRSRHDPSLSCAAIFDRVDDGATSVRDFGSLTEPRHRLLLASLLNRYEFGLV